MALKFFKNIKEIDRAALALIGLMQGWHLKPGEWMVGKYLSHYYLGFIKNPKEVLRDINVYVLKNKLPWKVGTKSRTIVPPAGALFAAYNRTQKKYNISIDFMPLPDKYLTKDFIIKKIGTVKIAQYDLNLETIEKFIYRLRVINDSYLKQKPAEFRKFYFENKERYAQRLRFYAEIKEHLHKKKMFKLEKDINRLIADYKKLIRRSYPELFALPSRVEKITMVKGRPLLPQRKIISGPARVNLPQITKGKKFIYIFSHFTPGDAVVLPQALAVVVEGEGLLSHAAIVCREMKVPCIIGAKAAVSLVKNGEKVLLDLQKGTVRKTK